MKDLMQMNAEIKRSEALLSNKNFIAKAPQNVVDGVRNNAAKLSEHIYLIESSIKDMQ